MNPRLPEITVFSAQILLGIGTLMILALLIRQFVRKRGQRFSFSLRWFVAFCLACSIALGGGIRLHLARKQALEYQKAVQLKKRLSTKVSLAMVQMPLMDALSYMNSICNSGAVLDSTPLTADKGNTPINLSIDSKAEVAFKLIAKASGLQCEFEGGHIKLIERSKKTLALDAERDRKFAQIISIDFSQMPFLDAIRALEKLSKIDLVLDEDVKVIKKGARIDLHLKDVEVRSAIVWVMQYADVDWDSLNDGELYELPDQKREGRQSSEIEKRLNACVVSFEFVDKPLSEALDFIAKSAKVNILVDPRYSGEYGKTTISLRVNSMNADLALQWILKLAELDYIIRNEVIFCSRKQTI